MTGPEGMVGMPVVLGAGSILRMTSADPHIVMNNNDALRVVLTPSVQTLLPQISPMAYANARFGFKARLARWILMTQDWVNRDELPMTHRFLPTMLGVRRSGVTTATHVLQRMAMIQNKRGRITLVDPNKLKALAGDSYGAAEDEYERLIVHA